MYIVFPVINRMERPNNIRVTSRVYFDRETIFSRWISPPNKAPDRAENVN